MFIFILLIDPFNLGPFILLITCLAPTGATGLTKKFNNSKLRKLIRVNP